MKICISGSACVGKSTLINDFLQTWPMYKKADNSYREKAKADPLVKLNKDGDENGQTIIRDSLIDQVQSYSKKDNVIFDRCILDNFVYSLWLNAKGKVTDDYISKQIPILSETLKLYDIIFFIPLLKQYDIPIVPDPSGQRELDPIFREEIDNIFKAVLTDYNKQKGKVFFPKEESPAVIEIFGSREERIEMIKLYVNKEGGAYGEDDSLIINPFDNSLDAIDKKITW
jgi:hypothetical protein